MKYNELTFGQMEAIVNKLGGMEGVKGLLSGNMELKVINHIIDCSTPPLIPYDGWKVEEHVTGKSFTWDPTKVRLHLSKNQMDGKTIEGNKLSKELKDLPVMNANVLDYLLDHPYLIPEEWKGNAVFFWGTIYRNSGDDLCVRCLIWGGGRWKQHGRWLGDDWVGTIPAIVSAS